MNRWLVGTTVALTTALTAPGIAWGGGFATVGLSSLPDGLRPGQPWVVELTVLQHGRTPLEGLRPAVTVAPADGGAVGRTFPARPTGEPGVYAARVVFPSAGRWRYEVDDGFTSTHTYAPVQIGGPPAVRAAGGGPWEVVAVAAAGLVALTAGGAIALAGRRRRRGLSDPPA